MPELVIDASIAVKWLNPHGSLSDKANLIREDYERGLVSFSMPMF